MRKRAPQNFEKCRKLKLISIRNLIDLPQVGHIVVVSFVATTVL